jgi:hypothetical protein
LIRLTRSKTIHVALAATTAAASTYLIGLRILAFGSWLLALGFWSWVFGLGSQEKLGLSTAPIHKPKAEALPWKNGGTTWFVHVSLGVS